MEVTELGMAISFSEVQPSKVSSPIEETESGMFIFFSAVQPAKAQPPMEVTESGMIISVSAMQSAKAPFPIEVTESGMFIFFREKQPEKAQLSMEVIGYVIPSTVIDEGIATDKACSSPNPAIVACFAFNIIIKPFIVFILFTCYLKYNLSIY